MGKLEDLALWHKVKVIAPVGTEFGIVKNSDGELTLTFHQPGEPWPHNITPYCGEMTIQEGCTSYAVVNEESL